MKKIAVLIWLYHEDLAKEIYDLLKPISQYVDIFLALCEDKNNRSIIDTMSGLNNVKNISFFPNCGADIYSFINQIRNVNPEEYEYFIKIHSKKNN
jgi:lipopolysaccharide biosynthesis protein